MICVCVLPFPPPLTTAIATERGFPNFDVNKGQFVGTAQTCDPFDLVVSGERNVPNLLRADDGERESGSCGSVAGELFSVNAKELLALDALESVDKPTGYRRETIRVKRDDGDGDKVDVQVYVRRREHAGAVTKDLRNLNAYTLEHAAMYILPAHRQK